jgi:hypothetical protein
MIHLVHFLAIHAFLLRAVREKSFVCNARRHQLADVVLQASSTADVTDEEGIRNPGEQFANLVHSHHLLKVKQGKLRDLKTDDLTCGFGTEQDFECNIKKNGVDQDPEDAQFVLQEGRKGSWKGSFVNVMRELNKHVLAAMSPEAKEMFMTWYRPRKKSKNAWIYEDRLKLVVEELGRARIIRNIERLFNKLKDPENLVPVKAIIEAINSKVPQVFRSTVITSLKRSISFFNEDAKINFKQFADQKLVIRWLQN